MHEWTRNGSKYLQGFCLLLILVVGMAMRLGTAAHTQVDHPFRNDAREYVVYAWNTKYEGVYSQSMAAIGGQNGAVPAPDAIRPPGYPLFLLGWVDRDLTDAFITNVTRAQAWIAGLTVLSVTLLAMALLGAWPGLAVGAMVALSPHQNIYVAYFLSETPFGAALMLALASGAAALCARQKRWRLVWATVSGLFFGVSCLIRPTLNQWVLFVLIVVLLVPTARRFWREAAVLALGFALMMSPWWVRNERVLHQMSSPEKMLTTVQQGSYVDLMYKGRPETYGIPHRFDPGAELANSSWSNLLADLRTKFNDQPGAMLRWYLVSKVMFFFSWTSAESWADFFTYPVLKSPWLTDPSYLRVTSIMLGLHVPMMLLGLLGTVLVFVPATRRLFGTSHADALRFLGLLHVFAIAVHVIGLPLARYSVPFQPLSFLLAVFSLVWMGRLYLEHRNRTMKVAPSHV